jgi:hypothetical protein
MIGSVNTGISSFSCGIRNGAGVYFLWFGETCIYTGQSVNVLKRVCEHSVDKVFDCSTYEPIARNDMTFVESYAIWFLRPKHNRNVPLLGSLGCSFSGKLKRRSIEFICRLLCDSLHKDKIADLFAEADHALRLNASKTSSSYYRRTLLKQADRNWRVREMVMRYERKASDGTNP